MAFGATSTLTYLGDLYALSAGVLFRHVLCLACWWLIGDGEETRETFRGTASDKRLRCLYRCLVIWEFCWNCTELVLFEGSSAALG